MPDDAHARRGSGAPQRDPHRDVHRGRLLDGRYLIGDLVARGGMASVYEATDTRLDRVCAVKIMHAGLGDEHAGSGTDGDFAARFVREARAAARLSHPNVVNVYDQGDDAGTVFLAMELVSGHTLRDTIAKESPMAPARALALLEPVLSALAAAHRAGLIHRDVKPENVLIADDGRVKVADFGLARAISAETQHTATHGVLIGTVSYLAPELVVDGRADARADVYAAGVVLYELLTGTKPHEGESPIAVAYKHVHHDVPPPSARVPGLPPYVDALVARATARDRALRPADAGVLLHQVHRVSQALATGVRDDPELTQDLALTTPLTPPLTTAIAEPTREPRHEPTRDESHFLDLVFEEPPRLTTSALAAMPPPPPPVLAPEPRGRAARPPKPVRTRRSRRGPVLLVLALVLALGIGGGAFYYGWARYTQAPSVLDLKQPDAEQALNDAGLTVAYAEPVYDRSAKKGTVLSADPSGGTKVLPGDTVTLTMSLGRDLVPQLRGADVATARVRLSTRQLQVGKTIQRYSETAKAGTILSTVPKHAAVVDPGTRVDLVVSNGRRPIKVLSWVGDPRDDAVAAIEGRDLVADVTEAFSDTTPAGQVISQEPGGGTLFRGDHVALIVSKGPELVEVPSVRAQGIDAARQALESRGFVVDVEKNPGAPGYLGLGFAVRTDPESGTMAPKGSTIVVYVI